MLTRLHALHGPYAKDVETRLHDVTRRLAQQQAARVDLHHFACKNDIFGLKGCAKTITV